MTWKNLNSLMSIVLIIGGIGYALNLNHSASQAIFFSSSGVGPTYFPNILTGLLVLLCIVTLIRNVRDSSPENTTKVETHNSRYILATLGLAIAFIASWQNLGYFYLNVFVLLTILLTIYRIEFGIGNSLLVGAVTSAFTTAFLFALFG
ncbi:tripartite tricarboxylate transporter TctB family protein [Tropicimonas sediminicola]|uniref:Tripartite tricarboxylate transporter TctB family protein n=1 Tax=Tropicimonas sediminicola TaxID=1031541 RepID=A0A239HSX8_9RHOB|nr:tripartite tricarboxylate transporter TctB family protein [Tropicimonas sediminicola]SNS84148.1 Tripartite tricarboxylate transporter TctB family protein [Tropicimonas sediminicola]